MNRKRALVILSAAALLTFTAWQGGVGTAASATAAAAASAAAINTNLSTVTDAVTSPLTSPLAAPTAAQAGSETITADTTITLDGDSIRVDGEGVTVDGSAGSITATITAAGAYSISGVLDDGQIAVDTGDEGDVTLILNGVDITNSSSAAINVVAAKDVILLLSDGSTNLVADGENYVFPDATTDEPNAAVFSKADLTISGEGVLSVTGSYNDGISSKDELVIESGSIIVTAVDDGIRGKDSIVVEDGNINVTAGGDGLKSDNEEDAARGYITVEGGSITVNAGGDAITAETTVTINGGLFDLTSGGGSGTAISEDLSAKGIKGGVSVTIAGGTFAIDAADDGVHANDSVTIDGGDLSIATGDDGIHADGSVTINGGDVRITQSVEGIEGGVITINDGNIWVVSSDDGVNVSGDGDTSTTGGGFGRPGAAAATEYTGDFWLYINGGNLVVDAQGDGLDANGAIEMTGGVVIVNGPTNSGNGALDYDATFNISGGQLVAAGSAGMAQAPSATSTQNSVLINFAAAQAAGTLVHIEDSEGNALLTFAPAKDFQSLVLSSADLVTGATYNVYTGGSSTGTTNDGLYTDGTYTPGDLNTSFTVSGTVTTVGNQTRGRMGRP